jgi:hypothetical protein
MLAQETVVIPEDEGFPSLSNSIATRTIARPA